MTAKMAEADKRKARTPPWYSDDEWDLIKRAAELDGVPVNTYVRERTVAAAKRRLRKERADG